MKTSNYEEHIIEILLKNNINFEREYSFKGLKTQRGGIPRFDFVIFNDQNEIEYIIEVDGEQHFHEIKHFTKTSNDFKYLQEADLQKNKYCLMNKYPLYRIPFDEVYNIKTMEEVLQNRFLVKNKWHNHILRNDKYK